MAAMNDTEEALQRLLADGEVVEADRYGPKVVRRADGSYLKIFRRKRLLTSALWYPYAQRFVDNAARLTELDIPCPQVLSLQRFADCQRDVVHYQPLPGLTLRQIVRGQRAALDDEQVRAALGGFVAQLHQLGILFRSIHLGNIVLGEDLQLGLIDFADLRFQRRPLGANARARNFAHLLRYEEDQRWLLVDGGNTFIRAYVSASQDSFSPAQVGDWMQRQRGAGR